MNTEKFNQFLNEISKVPLPVIDATISLESYYPIIISSKNKELLNFDISSSLEWEVYLKSFLEKNKAKIGFGGYLEKRNIYDRSDYFKNQSENNKRNIHLGIDLWCKENTKVLAVLDGEIHSFKNNKNYGDYGPTIILKHQIKKEVFYTLYGHLSLKSIENIKIGDTVLQGNTIGYLGDSSVNGEYAPHLHFQIIRDLEDNFGDYPGVSSKENIAFYKNNCPNPNLLLKILN
ncbi:peptidoglycan DD-metalloendopeptidase family protein [Polaribacter undariae]|uniref:Peptidoglycan DD-metalloendopeptidase family protein n=1 Tax=Polaribacter sejongensis TaxID=985043 RepID=A0AAJ1QYF5_9FLAO|nr:peptidoglycan DD-metalloendopeptidase family protein [Polaribacter undariae]MDN3620238.1 peptidoglycan DD-metalloendopeptidase family protein [Polaribacter undariae]UWD32639.1 peptidoglycan DD-metalloendopeptidase family protein [Polaribacter undariae]